MRPRRWRALLASAAMLALPAAPRPALGAGSSAPPTVVGEIVVVPVSPLGVAADPGALATPVAVLSAADLDADGEPDLLRSVGERLAGVTLDSASGNPEQPTLLYHGFQAGPLQGTAQGVAVYVDAVRFNAPFGDTVNFDLIPSQAVQQLTLEGANPAFGLNALGGSIAVRMKTGASFHGADASLSGGSFGKRDAQAEAGGHAAGWDLFGAVEAMAEDGWRDGQSSELERLAANAIRDIGSSTWRLDVRMARSTLNGPGVSPVQLLAADPAAQFTGPNAIDNRYAEFDVSGRFRLGERASLTLLAYVQTLRQQVFNGNVSDDIPCTDGSALLCSEAGDSTGTAGSPISAFAGPSPFAYSELAQQVTDSLGYGVSAEVQADTRLIGLRQKLSAGVALDASDSGFKAVTLVGVMSPARDFVGPGLAIDEPGFNQPVDLGVTGANLGVYAADAIELAPRLSLTASARLNANQTRLTDHLGGDLSGAHAYRRIDPAVGLAWRPRSWLAPYVGYSEANRTPTPAELSCASPSQSCSLADFFVADPDLRQVVARTWEAGLRGESAVRADVRLRWSADLYRTTTSDDIAFVNTSVLGRAYFANIGRTRRQGLDLQISAEAPHWRAFVAWSHVEATYLVGFTESGGSNPAAGADGNLTVRPGDRLPGVPRDQLKVGARWLASSRFDLGLTGLVQGAQTLFGDEADLEPPLRGYTLLSLDAHWRLSGSVTAFARLENALGERYATYGAFSPTASVLLAQAPGASDPRSVSPGAPRGLFVGARYRF
ncbi:MAG TPA: TonB-dependent receptor [Caulobacteraceae bacterium]|jgi:outer membrane receptor protein involved in Fe transport|nr:TonB-dependent receptor [Caulobacteraceae bacterium]